MSQNDVKKPLSGVELKETVKKRKNKKIIITVCVALAVIAVCAAVGLIIWQIVRIKPTKRTDEQAKVVGNVGGYDIYFDEFSYLVGIHKANYEFLVEKNGSDGMQSESEYVTEHLQEDIKKNYAVLTLCEKYGIDTDSRSIKKQVNEKIKEIIENDFEGDKKKYASWLEENNLSDAYYRLVHRVNILEEELLNYLVENGVEIKYSLENYRDFIEYVDKSDDFIRTTHVFYPKYYKYKTINADEIRAEVTQIAESLKNTKENDRLTAINKYIGNCPYLVEGYTMETLDGVYFADGMMGDEYESVAKSLGIYETSDVLETEDGFYVIMRLPKDHDYIETNGESLLSNYQYAKLLVMQNEVLSEMKFDCDNLSSLIDDLLKK